MSESFSYENLFAGDQKDIVQRPGTVRISESFSRGQLIGRLTSTGKWQTIDEGDASGCSDFGIAVEAVDTTDGVERNVSVYVEGEFNEDSVLYSYSDTADDWRELLALHGIYLRNPLDTTGV